MVDAPRLRAVLHRLEQRHHRLEVYAAMSEEEYLADVERVDASKYLLVTAVEDALSAANHVIAAKGIARPATTRMRSGPSRRLAFWRRR